MISRVVFTDQDPKPAIGERDRCCLLECDYRYVRISEAPPAASSTGYARVNAHSQSRAGNIPLSGIPIIAAIAKWWAATLPLTSLVPSEPRRRTRQP